MSTLSTYPRFFGSNSRRLNGAINILNNSIRSARAAEEQLEDPNGQSAAMLRGKVTAYREAITLMQKLDSGRPFKRHWFK